MKNFDLIIIGAGAVGCAVAYEAGRKGLRVCILEKNPDVGFETSARNSAVVHAGFNNKTGSLKAHYCLRGSKGFEELAAKLDVPYKKTGKYVVALNHEDEPVVDALIDQGIANGVNVEKTEYNGKPALYSPDTAITDPFKYTIALAEAAHLCGCEFYFESNIKSIERSGGMSVNSKEETDRASDAGKSSESSFIITVTFPGRYGEKESLFAADNVINCAGLGAAEICRLAGIGSYDILPCRGEYHIVDPFFGSIDKPVYPAVRPGADVLGIHLSPTIDGNIMIGPSSEYLYEYDHVSRYATTAEIMDKLFEEGKMLLPGLTRQALIRSFSGLRPKLLVNKNDHYDFLIENSIPGLINLLGIESPGLTASMPLAEDVVDMLDIKEKFEKAKPAIAHFPYEKLSGAANQICRCEHVTAGEILNAYDSITSINARPTLRGLKHRTRIGMGRCQGSFCTAEMITLLRRERGIDPLRFTMSGNGSEMFTERMR